MTISFSQSNQVDSSGTAVTCAFLSNNTAGAGIVASSRITSSATASFSDNNGNGPSGSYHVDVTDSNATAGLTAAVGSAGNISLSTHNPITVTISSSVSGTIRGAIHEFLGLANSGASTVLDGTPTTAHTTTAAPDSGTLTTTNAADLLFGNLGGSGTGATVSPGNMGTGGTASIGQTVATDKLVTEYAIVAATSSGYHANFSLSGAESATAQCVAYKGAATTIVFGGGRGVLGGVEGNCNGNLSIARTNHDTERWSRHRRRWRALRTDDMRKAA